MGKIYDEIPPEHAAWIAEQKLFFVATAPAGAEGHINCSPKGLDGFRIFGPRSVGYLDLTGSGAETIAHVRDNGRIVFLFCAFSGPPKILRIWGKGEVVLPGTPAWDELRPRFPEQAGARSIIRAAVTRVADSCGFGVPLYEYQEERGQLPRWAAGRGADGIATYQQQNNLQSIDGLPALEPR